MPQSAVSFSRFGGLRLDIPPDEVGGENAIYLRDVDWKNSTGTLRSRDGFEKANSTEASGEYKGIFPHSAGQLLATKRISSESVKLVALNTALEEKHETTWTTTASKPCFARFGTPTASYTYARAGNVSSHAVVRYNGEEFSTPKATVDGAAEKQFPRGDFMVSWPDGGNRLVIANTGSTGGPNAAASSGSHVWFSEPGNAEAYESTAFAQLSPGDGEEIVGMCTWNGSVFVFKETQFFVFYGVATDEEGLPEFLFRSVRLGDGTRISRSTQETLDESSDQICCAAPDGVFFCSTDGIYQTTGGAPVKISEPLAPLEEQSELDGPMATFLSGSTEVARWPAAGIVSLGRRLFVKRYEYLFPYDLDKREWLAWKAPNTSLAVWGRTSTGESFVKAKAPSTVTSAANGIGTVDWSNPSNAKTSDDSRAKATLESATSTKDLKATGFGFELPESATVTGIVLKLERGTEGNRTCNDSRIRLVKGGTVVGDNKALPTLWATSDHTIAYGGSEDLWGTTWTASEINQSTFGVVVAAESQTAGPSGSMTPTVDSISLTVYYTETEETEGIRPRLFIANGKFIYWTGPEAKEQLATRTPEWQSGFYDLGSEDEKSLVGAKLWGEGTVNLAVAKDFGEVGNGTEFSLGEGPAIENKSQTGTLFSHQFSGEALWSVQRLARYERESRVPLTKT